MVLVVAHAQQLVDVLNIYVLLGSQVSAVVISMRIPPPQLQQEQDHEGHERNPVAVRGVCGGGDWDLWDIHSSRDEDVDFAGARILGRKAVPQHLVRVPRVGGRHKKKILVLALEKLLDILDVPRRP